MIIINFIRSVLFSIVMLLTTMIFATAAVLFKPFPFIYMSRWLRFYALLVIVSLRYICGVRYEIQGTENIPESPFIIMSKHQSTWETYALQLFFSKICYVVKKELLWIPFFGWGLAAMKPISINRKLKSRAAQQVIDQGKNRLAEGINIVIFPEGTRTSADQPGKYKVGGALLAVESGAPVVPVAHNAGECWSRGGFIKNPGTVHVRIGPVIDSRNKTAEQVLAETKQWIESVMPGISKKYQS